MQLHVGVCGQPELHRRGLMSGKIIQDDVNLLGPPAEAAIFRNPPGAACLRSPKMYLTSKRKDTNCRYTCGRKPYTAPMREEGKHRFRGHSTKGSECAYTFHG
jgi:hypothetical protein